MKTMAKTFGQKLKAARKRAGLSQTEAAERAGVAQPHWVVYEQDARSPRLVQAEKLAAAVGVDLKELV